MISPSSARHFDIKIYGRVQGVFFRSRALHMAKKLGLKGFVRNEPDSMVYIEVEGEEPAVREFVEWCKEGPTFAKVTRTEVEEEKFKNFTEFSIL